MFRDRQRETKVVKIGAHALIWAGGWSEEEAQRTIASVAKAGFDFVELALAQPKAIDVARTRALLEEHELTCTCGLGLPASCHLPFAPERAEAFLREALDVAASLGAPILTGGVYTHLGARTGNAPTREEKVMVARVLKSVARRAADLGIDIGVENINRYETYLANRVADVLDLIDRIDEPNVVAHLDTYHANIEEKGFYDPIVAAGARLGYVHLSESDRGVPGTGNVRFDDVFRALAEIDYAGPMVVESFAPLSDEVIAMFALWHDHVGDPADFCKTSLRYLRDLSDRYKLPPTSFGAFRSGR